MAAGAGVIAAALLRFLAPVWDYLEVPAIVAVFVFAVFGIGYLKGAGHERTSCRVAAEHAAAIAAQAQVEATAAALAHGAEAEREYQQVLVPIQARTQLINHEVNRYVEAHPGPWCSLDADGLRIWTAANADDDPSGTAGGPDRRVPAAAATAERSTTGPAGESRPGDQPVPRVPGAPGRAGGVGDEAMK